MCDEEDSWERDRERLEEFIDSYPAPEINSRDLNEACYSASERSIMEDIEFDAEFAIRMWKLVERVRHDGFPEDLRM